MAKQKNADSNHLIVEALEHISRAMAATNDLLARLGERLTDGANGQAQPLFDGSDLQGRSGPDAAMYLRADTVRADEAVLRTLAGEEDLEFPMERLITLRNERYPSSSPRYWGIVNFDLHSAKPRLFVFDVVSQSVASYLCAHGIGSEGPTDDGYANMFSNEPGSNASSLGIYRCAETYFSTRNGYSLKLDGIQSTNSNARSRFIVVHGADYVSEAFARKYGRIGRSEGCPALDLEYASMVIDQLKLGSLLMLWKAP